MNNYCTICGKKRDDNENFCMNCGTNLNEEYLPIRDENANSFETQVAKVSKETGVANNIIYSPPTYYAQPQNYITPKPVNKKRRMILAITAIAIAFMMISTSLILILNTKSDDPIESKVISTLVREQGPKFSLHTLSAGTVSSIPKEGYTAVYGLYDESGMFGIPNYRLGSITEENLGEKTYQGEECIYIKINGDISIPLKKIYESYMSVSSYGYSDPSNAEMIAMIPEELSLNINSNYYVKKEDNTPVYMDYTIDLTEMMQMIKDMYSMQDYGEDMSLLIPDGPVIIGYTIDWDKDQSKADMQFYMEGIPMMNMNGDFSITFSEEYWDMEPEMEELYVGFEKIIDFTMTIDVNSLNFDMDYEIEEPELIQLEDYSSDYSRSLIQIDSEWDYDDTYRELQPEYEVTSSFGNSNTQTTSTTMKIKVINQEEVTVPAGTFEDCFVIEVTQKQKNDYEYDYEISDSSSTSSVKIWVNENGVMPKAEYSIFGGAEFGMGSSGQKLVIKLEDYTN